MNETDYPAIYQAADAAAKDAQSYHLASVTGLSVSALLGATLSLYGITSRSAAITATVLFLIGLGLSLLMAFRNFEATWYRARAVAESVKTTSWRFMMRADPFEVGADARVAFVNRLRAILSEHRDLALSLAGTAGENDQVTPTLEGLRDKPLQQRISFYKESRIANQRHWYADKSAYNRRRGRLWFCILVALEAGAVVCSLVRIANPATAYLPTEVFIVAAGGALGWMQVKRFRELAAAYAIAAQEIGLAAEELTRVSDEGSFSRFVGEMENAFSREHTQWIARKDFR